MEMDATREVMGREREVVMETRDAAVTGEVMLIAG